MSQSQGDDGPLSPDDQVIADQNTRMGLMSAHGLWTFPFSVPGLVLDRFQLENYIGQMNNVHTFSQNMYKLQLNQHRKDKRVFGNTNAKSAVHKYIYKTYFSDTTTSGKTNLVFVDENTFEDVQSKLLNGEYNTANDVFIFDYSLANSNNLSLPELTTFYTYINFNEKSAMLLYKDPISKEAMEGIIQNYFAAFRNIHIHVNSFKHIHGIRDVITSVEDVMDNLSQNILTHLLVNQINTTIDSKAVGKVIFTGDPTAPPPFKFNLFGLESCVINFLDESMGYNNFDTKNTDEGVVAVVLFHTKHHSNEETQKVINEKSKNIEIGFYNIQDAKLYIYSKYIYDKLHEIFNGCDSFLFQMLIHANAVIWDK